MEKNLKTILDAKKFARYSKIEKPTIVLKNTNPAAYIIAKEYEEAKRDNPDLERAVKFSKGFQKKMRNLM